MITQAHYISLKIFFGRLASNEPWLRNPWRSSANEIFERAAARQFIFSTLYY